VASLINGLVKLGTAEFVADRHASSVHPPNRAH
jgi:hypothetical protein